MRLKAARRLAVLQLALLLLVPGVALASEPVVGRFSEVSTDFSIPPVDTAREIEQYLEQNLNLTEPLNGQRVSIQLKSNWRTRVESHVGADGLSHQENVHYYDNHVSIEYPNGTRSVVEFEAKKGFSADTFQDAIEAIKRQLRETAGMARLTPASIDEELRWLHKQLSDGLATASESDAAVLKKLMAQIDAIKPPGTKFGLMFKKPIPPLHWMEDNYDKFVSLRDSAAKWGHELGFDVITYEEKQAADAALAESKLFLKPVKSTDRPLAEKVWDNVEGKELREVVEKHGGSVKISFEKPTWAIEPKPNLPGRAVVKGTVTITRADGSAQSIEVVAKVNTEHAVTNLMDRDEWVKPFAEQFQKQVANGFVEVDAFLGDVPKPPTAVPPTEEPAVRSRVATDAVAEPLDCGEAVDDVVRVLGGT